MIPVHEKVVAVTPPAAIVDDAAFATTAIDCYRFRHCSIYLFLGAMDIAMAGLKVQESDASDMTGAVDIVGTRVGTDVNDVGAASALPSATADNTFVKFEIDLRGRKRYLDLVMTGGNGTTGTFATAWAVLKRGEQCPTTAAQKGCAFVMSAPVIA